MVTTSNSDNEFVKAIKERVAIWFLIKAYLDMYVNM